MRDFIKTSFKVLGVDLEFSGTGANETGMVIKSANSELAFKEGQVVVGIDANYYRPTEVDLLIGDATKAREEIKVAAQIYA